MSLMYVIHWTSTVGHAVHSIQCNFTASTFICEENGCLQWRNLWCSEQCLDTQTWIEYILQTKPCCLGLSYIRFLTY